MLDGRVAQPRALDLHMLALEVDAPAVEQVADDCHHLVGASVALVVGQPGAVRADVEPEAAAREPAERVGLLGDDGGSRAAGGQRDEEADPLGATTEPGRERPRVGTAGRRRERVEPGPLRGQGRGGQRIDVGRPPGRQVPVQQRVVLGHDDTSGIARGRGLLRERTRDRRSGSKDTGRWRAGRGDASPERLRKGRRCRKRPDRASSTHAEDPRGGARRARARRVPEPCTHPVRGHGAPTRAFPHGGQ